MLRSHTFALPCLALAVGISACGSNGQSASAPTPPPSSTSSASSSSGASGPGRTTAAGTTTSGAAALAPDARSAATGDIPDNQVFLVYAGRSAGFSMKYPEGWTQSRSGHAVTFSDKNNLVRVTLRRGAAPTPGSVSTDLRQAQKGNPSLTFTAPTSIQLPAGHAVRTVYTTQSAANPVTGRRVTLIVDRYSFAHAGDVAVVDLGTPKGVDNVDAYRMMIESFRWR